MITTGGFTACWSRRTQTTAIWHSAAKAEVQRIVPGLTIAQLRAKRLSDNPEYVKLAEQYSHSGLREAGLPEKSFLRDSAVTWVSERLLLGRATVRLGSLG